jgi:hypothetical protein
MSRPCGVYLAGVPPRGVRCLGVRCNEAGSGRAKQDFAL